MLSKVQLTQLKVLEDVSHVFHAALGGERDVFNFLAIKRGLQVYCDIDSCMNLVQEVDVEKFTPLVHKSCVSRDRGKRHGTRRGDFAPVLQMGLELSLPLLFCVYKKHTFEQDVYILGLVCLDPREHAPMVIRYSSGGIFKKQVMQQVLWKTFDMHCSIPQTSLQMTA